MHLTLRPDIRACTDTPPTFPLQAEDNPVDDVRHSLTYYLALKKAGVPIELHLYAQGGHAFIRPTPLPIARWTALVEQWLHSISVLGGKQGG
jgi:acetyl esterase/lipase